MFLWVVTQVRLELKKPSAKKAKCRHEKPFAHRELTLDNYDLDK